MGVGWGGALVARLTSKEGASSNPGLLGTLLKPGVAFGFP